MKRVTLDPEYIRKVQEENYQIAKGLSDNDFMRIYCPYCKHLLIEVKKDIVGVSRQKCLRCRQISYHKFEVTSPKSKATAFSK